MPRSAELDIPGLIFFLQYKGVIDIVRFVKTNYDLNLVELVKSNTVVNLSVFGLKQYKFHCLFSVSNPLEK